MQSVTIYSWSDCCTGNVNVDTCLEFGEMLYFFNNWGLELIRLGACVHPDS